MRNIGLKDFYLTIIVITNCAKDYSRIDSYAIGKLASALCRMNLNEKMSESMISEATKIFENNYKQYIDLRERSEEHPSRQSYNLDYEAIPKLQFLPW